MHGLRGLHDHRGHHVRLRHGHRVRLRHGHRGHDPHVMCLQEGKLVFERLFQDVFQVALLDLRNSLDCLPAFRLCSAVHTNRLPK